MGSTSTAAPSKPTLLHAFLLGCFVVSFSSAMRIPCSTTYHSTRLRKSMMTTLLGQSSAFHSSKLTMMPEGPEVKALVKDFHSGIGQRLNKITFLSGRYHKNPPLGYDTFPLPATIVDWNCKGKFIYMVLDGEKTRGIKNDDDDYQTSIWITLGMTGRFVSETAKQNGDDQHIRWSMELEKDGVLTNIYYADMRNFGTLKFVESKLQLFEKLIGKLGPDVLASTDFENEFLECCEKNERWNICKLLMDQSKISGVGNYILAESLYRAKIDPFVAVAQLTIQERKRLAEQIKQVSQESYQSLIQNTTFEFEFQVYGREVTEKGETVRRETNGPHGRTIWYTDSQLGEGKESDNCGRVSKRARTTSVLFDKTSNVGQIGGETDSRTETLAPNQPQIAPRASGNGITRRTTRGQEKLAALLSNVPVDEPVKSKKITNPSSPSAVAIEESNLAEELLETIVEPGWKEKLRDRLADLEPFQKVSVLLETEKRQGETVFPPQEEIFAALNLCPLESLKVVIVGQDPYHARGQGHGLAFSVRKRVRAPPSLQNIFRELTDSIGIEEVSHGNLEKWAKQGVLLLNSVLTVREGKAYSHARKGWEEVTDLILQVACDNHKDLVFLLWGNAAAEKVNALINLKDYTVIRTSHPSPLGATKTDKPFMGSGCFRRANQALIDSGLDPIDWNVGD